MSKCTRCHRELKNHAESGMGKVCQMKSNRLNDSSDAKVIIEMIYDNKRGHRNYLVRTGGIKAFVGVANGVARCHYCPADESLICEHAALINENDELCAAHLASLETEAAGEVETVEAVEDFGIASRGFVNVTEKKVIAAATRAAVNDYTCQVRKTDAGKYVVFSFASGNFYNVEFNRGIFGVTAHCSCPDFTVRRLPKDEVCKHISAIYHFERRSQIVVLSEVKRETSAAVAA